MTSKLKRSGAKAMYAYMDVDAAMVSLYKFEHAYIVGTYLVVYELVEPWYVTDGTLFLAEQLVLALAVSGDTNFADVPAFLERKAREAGCALALVGTALAKADGALASLYIKQGFKTEALTLTKEPTSGISH